MVADESTRRAWMTSGHGIARRKAGGIEDAKEKPDSRPSGGLKTVIVRRDGGALRRKGVMNENAGLVAHNQMNGDATNLVDVGRPRLIEAIKGKSYCVVRIMAAR